MIFFFQLDLCDMTMKGGGVKCKYPPVTSLPIIDAATMMEQKNEWLIICHISGVACPTFSVGHISLHQLYTTNLTFKFFYIFILENIINFKIISNKFISNIDIYIYIYISLISTIYVKICLLHQRYRPFSSRTISNLSHITFRIFYWKWQVKDEGEISKKWCIKYRIIIP